MSYASPTRAKEYAKEYRAKTKSANAMVERQVCGCGCGNAVNPSDKLNSRSFLRGHNRRKENPYIVNPLTGCWEWNLALQPNGYPMSGNGLAHRVYYERLKGPIPVGFQLDHKCKVIRCVNPDHLEPVTPAENSHRSSASKLTHEIVRDLRARYIAGTLHQDRAARSLGLKPLTINKAVRNHTWRDEEYGIILSTIEPAAQPQPAEAEVLA